jgi:tetratricopeptide (TPR) repeat protein
MENLDVVDTQVLKGVVNALKSSPSPNKAVLLKFIGNTLRSRYERSGSIHDLDLAIETTEEGLRSLPDNHPDRPSFLNNSGVALLQRYRHNGSLDDLETSIRMKQMAVNTIADDHPDRPLYLSNLGNALQKRSQRTGKEDDLEAAITAHQTAIDLTPHNDVRGIRLNNLSAALIERFERTRSIEDLNRAIEACNAAIKMTAPGDLCIGSYLTNLGIALRYRFEATELIADLDSAIRTCARALRSATTASIDRPRRLNNLGLALRIRFERTGSLNDIRAAICAAERAIEMTPPENPSLGSYLSNLAVALHGLFHRTGSSIHLNSAINVAQQALKRIPKDHPDRGIQFNSLATALLSRFERTGSIDDLNSSIEACNDAVESAAEADFHISMYLRNLGTALAARFARIGLMNDLNTAVQVIDKAVTTAPEGDPNRDSYFWSLGNVLYQRFQRLNSFDDLNLSIEARKAALSLTSEGHHRRAIHLSCLSNALRSRFEQTHSSDDLNTALLAITEAVMMTPVSHPALFDYMNVLGIVLLAQFDVTKAEEDLSATIRVLQTVVEGTHGDSPDRAGYLSTLGMALHTRFEIHNLKEDFDAAVDAYTEAVELSLSPPIVRIISGIRAARLLYLRNVNFACQLLTTAIELLPQINFRTLYRNDQQFQLSQFYGLAGDAAALSIEAGKEPVHALQLLELARGIIASVHLEMRSDLALLEEMHPDLADKYKRLCDELNSPSEGLFRYSGSQGAPKSENTRRYNASGELERTILSIRRQNGFSKFLLGPSLEDLKQFASNGPMVVINASRDGSRALLVTMVGVQCVVLEKLEYCDIEINSKKFLETLKNDRLSTRSRGNAIVTQILAWLWEVVAEPILTALGFVETPKRDDEWSRVWWIPVGLLTVFPLHAAGHHSINTRQTVLDRVISSYTPTIKALDHARNQTRKLSQNMSDDFSQTVLLVSMPTTPNRRSLPFAETEVSTIESLLPQSINRISLSRPLRSEVFETIHQCSVAHFACHGEATPNPSESRILFSDWEGNPFSAGEMTGLNLEKAELAYISACHTASNRDFTLLDEQIHIAGAFQLAGFPSVIGTMWHVSDEHSAEVAKSVYRAMLTRDNKLQVREAARGLHFAVREIRDAQLRESRYQSSDPLTWAAYIHVGI